MTKCDLCGEEVPDDKIRHVHINRKVKNICPGCIAAIKGMM